MISERNIFRENAFSWGEGEEAPKNQGTREGTYIIGVKDILPLPPPLLLSPLVRSGENLVDLVERLIAMKEMNLRHTHTHTHTNTHTHAPGRQGV